MKKYSFLLTFASLLFAGSLMAQPTQGQYFGTLRELNVNYQNRLLENPITQLIDRQKQLGISTHLQAGYMLSEKYAVMAGLNFGFFDSEQFGNFSSFYVTGISLTARRWIPAYKTLVAHLDAESRYAYQWSTSGVQNDAHDIRLGIMPGISWFFRPKWSLEGRITGLSMQFRSHQNILSVEDRNFSTSYNVNPFSMQFAISRFF